MLERFEFAEDDHRAPVVTPITEGELNGLPRVPVEAEEKRLLVIPQRKEGMLKRRFVF